MGDEALGYEAGERVRQSWISRAWVGLRGFGDEWDARASSICIAMLRCHGQDGFDHTTLRLGSRR
jgi:hypothetical protein